jgi:hypothetical protein
LLFVIGYSFLDSYALARVPEFPNNNLPFRWTRPSGSPTTRRADGLYFSAESGKIQRHVSAFIGVGVNGCKNTPFENTQ